MTPPVGSSAAQPPVGDVRPDEVGSPRLAQVLRAPRVSVVIPALNEARNLPHVFARLPRERVSEVILVDGHSTDETVAVARALYPAVRLVRQDGVGKGNALACGFAAARGDIIVTLDADGSADPDEIPRYLDCLDEGAEFAKGSRFIEGGGSADITRFRRAGNRFLIGVMNTLFGTRYTDLCYGYNAFWTRLLPELEIDCDGFEVETLMNVRAAKAGLRVSEVPSVEAERIHGASNLRPVRDGCRVLRTIIRERLHRHARGGARATEPGAPGGDVAPSTVAIR